MLATPEALVNALPVDRVALALAAGAVKVTMAPTTGRPLESVTVTWRALGKALFNGPDCGVPPVAVMLAGGPGGLAVGVAPNRTVTVPLAEFAVSRSALPSPLKSVTARGAPAETDRKSVV